MNFIYFRMDKTKMYRKKPINSINSHLSASNSNLTNITPINNRTPKNVNHRSKSNLNIKENDTVKRIKSKYNINIININFKM